MDIRPLFLSLTKLINDYDQLLPLFAPRQQTSTFYVGWTRTNLPRQCNIHALRANQIRRTKQHSYRESRERQFNLLPSNLGRSISIVRHNLKLSDLEDFISEVISSVAARRSSYMTLVRGSVRSFYLISLNAFDRLMAQPLASTVD